MVHLKNHIEATMSNLLDLLNLSGAGSTGGYQVGDFVATINSTTISGQTLLDCDGSLITPASYPSLEALIATGYYNTEEPFYQDGTTQYLYTIKGIPDTTEWIGTYMSSSSGRFTTLEIGSSPNNTSLLANRYVGLPCISNDGQTRIVPFVDQQSAVADFDCYRTTTGESATIMDNTAYTINATNTHYGAGSGKSWHCAAMCSSDGATVLAYASLENSNTLYRYKSTNNGVIWSGSTSVVITDGGSLIGTNRSINYQSYDTSDNLADYIYLVLGTGTNHSSALFVSTDEGLTFTWKTDIGQNYAPVYCSSNGLKAFIPYTGWFTDDGGVTSKIITPPTPTGYVSLGRRNGTLSKDGTTLIYVVLCEDAAQNIIDIMFTSLDDGVTWSTGVIIDDIPTPFNNYQTWLLNAAKDTLRYGAYVNTSAMPIGEFSVATGKNLPNIPGIKIVAEN